MILQHDKPGNKAERVEKLKTTATAFATAALLSANIFGCVQNMSKQFDAECSPCRKCTVPADATLLTTGVATRAPGITGVSFIANADGSVSAFMSDSAIRHRPATERMDFDIAPGDVCTIRISGEAVYQLYKSNVFMEPVFVYSSPNTVGLSGL